MATEPIAAIPDGTAFLNFVTRVLNRCPGQWDFASFPTWDRDTGHVDVIFLNTGRRYQIWFNGEWHAIDESEQETCQRLTGMLRGGVRDEAGVVRCCDS